MMEGLRSKHQLEQKELQGRVTQRKKNATKKTRRGINEECERLQTELRDRQKAEIDCVHGQAEVFVDSFKFSEDSEEADSKVIDPSSSQNHSLDISPSTQKKPNRQKARLARRAAEQEVQAQTAAREAASLPDLRSQEVAAMERRFAPLGFKEISIRPDGHCLYSAVATLLQRSGLSDNQAKFASDGRLPYQAVRAEAARFINENPADFEAFLEEPILQYTHNVKNTTMWGGQIELQAIARAYRVNINVLEADGRVEKIPCETEADYEPVWLTYYRHSFGLGEHYNALIKDP